MADLAIKKRLNRAVKSAASLLDRPEYGKVIILDNHVFHIEAIRDKEIRKIRITLDEITDNDINLVKKFELPEICTKEIWCKKRYQKNFVIKKIL